jgi:hypothetical protein
VGSAGLPPVRTFSEHLVANRIGCFAALHRGGAREAASPKARNGLCDVSGVALLSPIFPIIDDGRVTKLNHPARVADQPFGRPPIASLRGQVFRTPPVPPAEGLAALLLPRKSGAARTCAVADTPRRQCPLWRYHGGAASLRAFPVDKVVNHI